MNGEPVSQWSDWVSLLLTHRVENSRFEVLREGRTLFVRAVPEAVTAADGSTAGRLGVAPVRKKSSTALFKATQLGAAKTWDMTVMTLSMMKKMIAGSVSAENLVGPVGIVKIAGDSVRVGWQFFSTLWR